MINKILVGVDDSETAARAAVTAAELADTLKVELHVMTAYGKFEVEHINLGGDEFIISTEQGGLTVAEDVLRPLRKQFPALRATPHAREGKPAGALVELAEQLAIDLIVVGNKRVQGISRVLGSIARDVVTQAPCDVYVAHTN